MTTTRTIHHFAPWTVADGRRIVAEESAWDAVRALDKSVWHLQYEADREHMRRTPASEVPTQPPALPRITVLIGCDLFAPGDEPIMDHAGVIGCIIGGTNVVRSSIINLIDTCPHLDFILPTRFVENVERMMPPGRQSVGSYLMWRNGDMPTPCEPRPNLILAASIRTQADADAMIPDLLRLSCVGRRAVDGRGATKRIVLDRLPFRGAQLDVLSGWWGTERDVGAMSVHRIDLILTDAADTGGLREQAEQAGVECITVEPCR